MAAVAFCLMKMELLSKCLRTLTLSSIRGWYKELGVVSKNIIFWCKYTATTDSRKRVGVYTFESNAIFLRIIVRWDILVSGETWGKGPLGRSWSIRDDNIKMDLRDVGWEMDWIDLTQDRHRRRELVNAIMNILHIVHFCYYIRIITN